MPRSNPNFLNGVPELLVLQILSEQELYGYDLVRAIRLRSKEELQFGEGSVYPLLHSLTASGELSVREDTVSGRRRYYYRVTAKGLRKLKAMSTEWVRVSHAITGILGEKHV